MFRKQFDDTFENINDLKPAINVYLTVKKFLTHWNVQRDRQRFEKLCRYLISSLVYLTICYIHLDGQNYRILALTELFFLI